MRWKKHVIDKIHFTTRTIELSEFNDSKERLIKIVQQQHFSSEINCLKQSQNVSNKSKLRFWRPWFDKKNVLRVGGRLNKTESISIDARNPILLPAKSALTKLIFEYEHRRLLHAGPQALLSGVREQFWPMDGRNIARKTVHKCVQCFRTKPVICQPICGDLPKDRVEPRRPFEVCGVDYAGPILVKTSLRRNAQMTKGYICVFICFVTKAVHLELVGDLSTNAFLAALRRFWSRRGMSKTIYSDNGTNFVGANRQLRELRELFLSELHKEQVQEFATEIGVQWKFIPPRAPHFGGLWEAAVKSVKGHLRRILGNAMLIYEELFTVLVRIEACLNSRPITPLSSDPTDLKALTPGHFLTGSSLNDIPDTDISTMSPNRLRRWQRTVQLTQQIWYRWRTEYLSQLQGRQKWVQSKGAQLK